MKEGPDLAELLKRRQDQLRSVHPPTRKTIKIDFVSLMIMTLLMLVTISWAMVPIIALYFVWKMS